MLTRPVKWKDSSVLKFSWQYDKSNTRGELVTVSIGCKHLRISHRYLTSCSEMIVSLVEPVFVTIKLTSMDIELISDLPADLCWGDVLLSIQCVHHIQLLVLNQF